MRLLANENIPPASVSTLREAGYDVRSAAERSPEISDTGMMEIAHAENRIVLTFDRDYGELIFYRRLSAPAGVFYLRFLPASPLAPARYVAQLLASRIELEGRFTTGDREQVRQRPMAVENV